MSDKTILSSFYSEEDARKAESKIRALGVETTQVTQLHAYSGFIPERRTFPISGNIESLASLTLNTETTTPDTGVLLAADPSASGMTDGQDNITGRNWLLTVVCEPSLVEPSVDIIKDCNGYT